MSDKECRDLFLDEEIDSKNISKLIKQIIKVNKEDDEGLKKMKNYEVEPMKLYINTFGGSVYDGLALMNAMSVSKTPIDTIAMGSVMSMGLPIYLLGRRRCTTKYATFMQHEVGGEISGNLTSIRQRGDEWKRIDLLCEQVILDKTKITRDKLDDILNRKLDYYMCSDEAIELGVADEMMLEL